MADQTQSQPAGKQGDPSQLSTAAAAMKARRDILRACYGGTETMRGMGNTFLPQYDKESTTRWNTRLASTFALNKVREAVDAASAKPFKTLMKVNNTDPDLDLWVNDIDLQGNHLHVFAHQFFNNAMLDGQCHALADHPSTTNLPNLAAQQASGARPYLKLIRDADLVAAYSEYIGGDTQVTHARIRGTRIERTSDFKEKIWNQVWVIEKMPGDTQGVVQLWEAQGGTSGGGGWTFISETPFTLAEIPLVSLFAGDREGDFVTRPVFMDLAYKQIEHWISSSDQRSILAAARFPMLACSGVQIDPEDEAQFAIGPYKVLYSPEANGRWYFVEPKGTAIASGQKDLETLELQMDMMALNPVPGTHRQYVPQNERDIQETRVHSVVHDMALGCKDAMEQALRFMGLWANKDYSQVTVGLNLEFSNAKDKLLEVAQLVKLWEKRGLSRGVMLQEMRNRDMLGDDFDMTAELKLFALVDQIDASGQMLPGTWTVAGGATSGAPAAANDPASTAADPKAVTNWPAGQNRPTVQV